MMRNNFKEEEWFLNLSLKAQPIMVGWDVGENLRQLITWLTIRNQREI